MTIFRDVNSAKLDSFIGLVQSHKVSGQPIITEKWNEVLSNDINIKANACARFFVEWQNNLNSCKADPECKFLFNADLYDGFTESQKFLNKLKRKFSRLVIETMAPENQQKLVNAVVVKYHLGQSSIPFIEHMFRYHGDDACCLELLGEQANFHTSSSCVPPGETVDYPTTGPNKEQPHGSFILAVASAAEHFPLASNAWGYHGQESSPLTTYTLDKRNAARERLKVTRGRNILKLNKNTPWDRVVKSSDFEKCIREAKLNDGTPIGNCLERGIRVFHQSARQRTFDETAVVGLSPGDHLFVISEDPVSRKYYILDAWNGAKIYPENEKGEYLYDYLKQVNLADGKPYLKKFDPAVQKILIHTYNIYPLQAFKTHSASKHLFLLQLLEQFHNIPNQKRADKMIKALEIIHLIETKMPLYEYIDSHVQGLYDQLLYLTKKERKKGLKYSPPKDEARCLINEALKNLDLTALQKHIDVHERMDPLTILHAIKASLRANDIRFLKAVVDAGVPIIETTFTKYFHADPGKAILQLASELSAANGSLDFTEYCAKAVKNKNNNW